MTGLWGLPTVKIVPKGAGEEGWLSKESSGTEGQETSAGFLQREASLLLSDLHIERHGALTYQPHQPLPPAVPPDPRFPVSRPLCWRQLLPGGDLQGLGQRSEPWETLGTSK